MIKTIIIGLLLISLSSCQLENEAKKGINGLWILQSHGDSRLPELFDFKDNGELIVKRYHYKDTSFKYSLIGDTILKLNNADYKIISNKNDSLIFINDFLGNSQSSTLIRPIETSIQLQPRKIKDIFKSNIWTSPKANSTNLDKRIEYVNDSILIHRYKRFDNLIPDTILHCQIENWNIVEYSGYTFLYNYVDKYSVNGFHNQIMQLLDISDSSYTIDRYGQKIQFNSINFKPLISTDLNLTNWVSINTRSNGYRTLHEDSPEHFEHVVFYEGLVKMTIDSSRVKFGLANGLTKEYHWSRNLDNTLFILMTEFKVDEVTWGEYTCSNILYSSDSLLTIELFDNMFYGGSKNRKTTFINFRQDFKRHLP